MEPVENENVAKEGEEVSLNEHEEASATLKKRSRRVSFADITSVHVFDRDEDYETPPDNKPVAGIDKCRTPSGGSPRLHRHALHGKDSRHRLTLTPTSSFEENDPEQWAPEADTPGSISDGGTPSEGEFFGPVSLWHIQPGMAARSPLTDDVTLDCTTFSLQFSKLVPPDKQCGNRTEDMKTPSGDIQSVSLAIEDFKTPAGETAGVSPGNSMVLTKVKKPAWRHLVSDDEPSGADVDMNDMSLVEESERRFDYASMPPDLSSLLAEKYSQMQTDISSSQQSCRQEPFGSSSISLKSADSLLRMGQNTKLKDPVGVEVERVTTEAMAINQENGARLMPGIEGTPITIENIAIAQNKNKNLTVGKYQKQQPSSLNLCWDMGSEDHVGEAIERSSPIEMQRTKKSSNAEVAAHIEMNQSTIEKVEMNQSIIESGAIKHDECIKLTPADKSSLFKFGPDQLHERQQRRLLKFGLGMEPKDSVDVELETPTAEIMVAKHNTCIRLTADVTTDQSSIDVAATTPSDGCHHFVLGGKQQQQQKNGSLLNQGSDMQPNNTVDVEVESSNVEHQAMKNNHDTELLPTTEMNQSTAEIVAKKHRADIELIPAGDSSFLNFVPEQQQQQQGRLLKPGSHMESKNPVNVQLEISDIETMTINQNSYTELKLDVVMDQMPIQVVTTMPEGGSYFSNSRVKHGQHQRRLLNQGSATKPNNYVDVAVEKPSIEMVEAEQNNGMDLTPDVEMTQSAIETATTNHKHNTKLTTVDDSNTFDFKQKLQQHENWQIMVQDMPQKDPVSINIGSSNVDVLAAEDDNGTALTVDVKMDVSATDIMATECNKDTKLTPADDAGIFNFQSLQERQQKHEPMRLLNPGWDTEPKDHIVEEVETTPMEIMAAENNIDTNLIPDVEMTQSSIEIVTTKYDKGLGLTSVDDLSVLNEERRQDHCHCHQQQKLLSLGLGTQPKELANVPVERSGIEIMATKHSNESKLASDVEMSQEANKPVATGEGSNTNFTLADKTSFQNLKGKCYQQQGERFSSFNRVSEGTMEISSGNKYQEQFFSSLDANLNSRRTPLTIQHSGEGIKLVSMAEKVTGMESTPFKKDLLPVFSLSSTDNRQACNYPKLTQLDVFSHEKQQKQQQLEHSTLKPKLPGSQYEPSKLVSEGEGQMLSSLQPAFDLVTNNAQERAPLSMLGSIKTDKCDNLTIDMDEVKGCNVADIVFSMPANLITLGNGNISCPVDKSTQFSNLPHQSCEHKVSGSLQDCVRNMQVLTGIYGKHTVTPNDEEAVRLGPQEMQINNNHGNNPLPSSQLKGTFAHEQMRSEQRSEQYRLTDPNNSHMLCESTMMQCDSIGSNLKTNEDTHSSEKAPYTLSQGDEELHLPLITRPKALQECLTFMFLSRSELCLLQDTLKQLRQDMDNMKISTNLQFRALDGQTYLEMGNKLIIQRSGNIKWLQQMLAYEKSKLLLLQAKKEQLMKKTQELRSGCLEVDKLRSLCLQNRDSSNRTDRLAMEAKARAEKESHIQSLKSEIRKQMEKLSNKKALMERKLKGLQEDNQKTCETLIVMKQELDALDMRIKEFCEFYCGFFKINGTMTKEEITELIENHVKKRTSDSLVLQNMHLWKLEEVKSKAGQHLFELNYSDVLRQRIVIEGCGLDSNVFTSQMVNYETIEKVFPLMNACKAFESILGSKRSYKTIEARNIYQRIRETSFLVGSLIDVLEEVQLSRMRLHNLSFTHFHCVNDCELHLQLTFIDCTVGLKANVVLDVNSLRFGAYPSDVLPFQVEIEHSGRQPKSLLVADEIHEAILPLHP